MLASVGVFQGMVQPVHDEWQLRKSLTERRINKGLCAKAKRHKQSHAISFFRSRQSCTWTCFKDCPCAQYSVLSPSNEGQAITCE